MTLRRATRSALMHVGVIVAVQTRALAAQERLVGDKSIGTAMQYESITFRGAGLLQSNFAGLDTARVTQVHQFGVLSKFCTWP